MFAYCWSHPWLVEIMVGAFKSKHEEGCEGTSFLPGFELGGMPTAATGIEFKPSLLNFSWFCSLPLVRMALCFW